MGKRSRDAGRRGERLAVEALAAIGIEGCSRTAQRSGRQGLPDVEGRLLDGLHVEVKYGRNPRILPAMRQAERDASGSWRDPVPVVLSRQLRSPFLLSFRLPDIPVVCAVFRKALGGSLPTAASLNGGFPPAVEEMKHPVVRPGIGGVMARLLKDGDPRIPMVVCVEPGHPAVLVLPLERMPEFAAGFLAFGKKRFSFQAAGRSHRFPPPSSPARGSALLSQ